MIHNVSLFPVRLFCTLKLFLLPRDTVTFRSHVDITEDSGRDQVRYLSKTFKFCVKSLVLCCICDCGICNLVVI